MILFLSKYPQTPEEYRDGFYQRVENIDNFYKDDERVYLKASLTKNWKLKITQDKLQRNIECNLFLHFFLICSLFRKSSMVYIQSIYNAFNLIFFIICIKNIYILDLHGVVPEELNLQNKKIYAKLYSCAEKILMNNVQICVAVTNYMVKYFKDKYPKSRVEYLVYAILPSHLKSFKLISEEQKDTKVEIIYSGNMQIWQNIDLMLKSIKMIDDERINFTILTGEPVKFSKKVLEFGIPRNRIKVLSVKPDELEGYYIKSNYGFVLRDDIIVNKVACPTKIIEYLNYGIIPIVLSEKIGDFNELGYEFISIEQLNSNIVKKKSIRNIEIVNKILEKNSFDLREEISKILIKY